MAKKQKPSATSPLEILLEFKRNPSDEETTVEGLAVAAENDNIPKEFVDEKVDQIIVDEEAVFVGIDDAAIAEIPVAEAMPVTTMETTKTDEKEMEIDIKTLSTSTQTDPQSIPEVLLSTSQSSYQTLLQKYNLLKSTCTSSSLDTYKSLHQGRMKELERTIEILSGQTPDGISLKAFEEMQEQIKSLQEKNVDLERMANLHLSNQLEVVKVKEVLEKKVEEISNQLNGVLEDRSRVVLELGEVTSLLSKESLKVKKAEEEFMKLRMEKCDLEAKLGQSDALLAKINVKNGNVNGIDQV